MAGISVDSRIAANSKGAQDDSTTREDSSHESTDKQPNVDPSQKHDFCYHGRETFHADLKTWVLVVYYMFEEANQDTNRSEDVRADLKYLQCIFNKRKNCKFKAISPTKNELLDLFSQEIKMQKLFEEKEEPDIFVIFISTHGYPDGQLTTDKIDEKTKKDETFNLSEILHRNLFENKLKLVFVAACRGHILEKQSQMGLTVNLNETTEERLSTFLVSKKLPSNKNAVRITLGPNAINWIITYSCVETTNGVRDRKGTFLVQAFTRSIEELECDVDLAVFLTRVSRYAEDKNKEYGVGITVEAKFFRHPHYADLKICRVPGIENIEQRQRIKESFIYNFTSEIGVPLKGENAHFYCNCKARDCECHGLQKELKSRLAFDINRCRTKNELEISMQRENSNAAILICIVTKLSIREENNLKEIYADMRVRDEENLSFSIQAVPVKEILYPLIPASTTNYVGKPKVCIFLHKDKSQEERDEKLKGDMDFAIPSRTCRSGTMHSGLVILILPQENATEFFRNRLAELSVDSDTSYQQVFYEILQSAESLKVSTIPVPVLKGLTEDTIEGEQPSASVQSTTPNLTAAEPIQSFAIEPQYISTAPLLFNIQYPKPIATRFNIERNGEKKNIDKHEDLFQAITQHSNPSVWLIHSLPELGKSYLINYLDKKLKNERSMTFINMLEDFKFLQHEDTCFASAKRFIKQFHYQQHIERDVFQDEIVIMDDFDAADNQVKKNMLMLVPDFIECGNSVWIGSRSHEKLNILRTLADLRVQENVNCLGIDRWNDEEQRVLFRRCLANDTNYELQEKRFREWQAQDLLQSPWILRKIAAKLKKEEEEKAKRERSNRTSILPDTSRKDKNLYKFCKELVTQRVEDVMEGPRMGLTRKGVEFDPMYKQLMKFLQLCALVYFAKEDSRNKKFFSNNEMVKKINHIGIFSIENTKIIVVSETLAKYLAVEALLLSNKEVDQIIKFEPHCYDDMRRACEIMTSHYNDQSKGGDQLWHSFHHNSAIFVGQPNIFHRCMGYLREKIKNN
ncbi:uncharacterized protein LOC132202088 [Neocloeon triangulifer]|uniref:uncharacterized protein LOC132202088 n=1 Tax=Neocloeon triangulifer TaxID=2078957 RepID=UPI00286EC0F3|nr:uncharacterized protein LOC132202088 [Neocloeon triangulifer]